MLWLVSLHIAYIKFEHITTMLKNYIGFQSKFKYLLE